jgi:CDP-diacylglycerol--serine O-phosphatidyltransferase
MKRQRTTRTLKERSRFHKGIYILPNLFTSLNLFFGFFAIILSIEGNFTLAATLIIIAGLCDGLDGKIARATRTTSKFGVEYDSLADLVSFGIAPAIMFYLWVLTPLGRLGWLAGFLFAVCGALRLARFNTQAGSAGNDFFTGLPIPAAAGTLATMILFCQRLGLTESIPPVFFMLSLYGLSFLMVSTIRYHSFKKPELFRRMNFNVLVGVILIFIFVAAEHGIALFLAACIYVASGPMLRIRHRKAAGEEDALTSEEKDEHPRVV